MTVDSAVLSATPVPEGLARDHALLLRDTRRRALPVLELADRRIRPDEELRTLIRYLRTDLLRQVSDEESVLFPNFSPGPDDGPFADLNAEHARLYELTERLQRVHDVPGSVDDVAALVRELLTTLEAHLIEERAVLATERPAPQAGDEPVVIDLDALPHERAAQLGIERVLRLRPGQAAEIRSADRADVHQVGRWLHDFDSVRYGLSYRAPAADGRQLVVTCRPTG